MSAPFIPDDAPFALEQRAWLAGFLAGMSSRLAAAAADAVGGSGGPARPPLRIAFGSQTGNASGVADALAAQGKAGGIPVTVSALDDLSPESLTGIDRLVVVVSTYGEGEMPDNAELFWEELAADTMPRLEHLSYSVLALGDTSYDDFCQAGKFIDLRLEQLGATRLGPRVDCDVEFEDDAAAWTAATLATLAELDGVDASADAASGDALGAAPAAAASGPQYSRKNPLLAPLATNRILSGAGSAKEIRHYEFDLAGSGLTYAAGDALAVLPTNDPALVDRLLTALRVDGDEQIDGDRLGDLLSTRLEIRSPSRELLAEIAARTSHDELGPALRQHDRAAVDHWLWGHDIVSLLELDPAVRFDPVEFAGLLHPLKHRAYSISSSPNAVGESVHLTVASVRHERDGRQLGGVASTFLADRLLAAADGSSASAGIFLQANAAFRVPADGDRPLIMVGPGTGIAPFRAFLQEREATGASGGNWLFFGDQHRATDFIYEDELTGFADRGVLTKLDLAFSRDQAEKVYVQTRMLENAAELFAWLEDGASFTVCGDASRMAKDVEDALHTVVEIGGGRSPEAAAEYVKTLKREKRYVRDVY